MKALVTQFHALNVTQLNRGGWLYPNTTYEWVWRTGKGAHVVTVTIAVRESGLELSFPIESTRVLQRVSLAYSAGPHGGKRPLVYLPAMPTASRGPVPRSVSSLLLSALLQPRLPLPVPVSGSKLWSSTSNALGSRSTLYYAACPSNTGERCERCSS